MGQIITISILAYTWTNLLTTNGEIFDFFPRIVQYFTMNQKINKVLYACEKCVAGQIALWYTVFHCYPNYCLSDLLLVPFCIFTTFLISKLLK